MQAESFVHLRLRETAGVGWTLRLQPYFLYTLEVPADPSGGQVHMRARAGLKQHRRGARGGRGVDPLDCAAAAESYGQVWLRRVERREPKRNSPPRRRAAHRPKPGSMQIGVSIIPTKSRAVKLKTPVFGNDDVRPVIL